MALHHRRCLRHRRYHSGGPVNATKKSNKAVSKRKQIFSSFVTKRTTLTRMGETVNDQVNARSMSYCSVFLSRTVYHVVISRNLFEKSMTVFCHGRVIFFPCPFSFNFSTVFGSYAQ